MLFNKGELIVLNKYIDEVITLIKQGNIGDTMKFFEYLIDAFKGIVNSNAQKFLIETGITLQ
jgi:hypothetical protein